ncbi:MAG: hypothetical protein TEF_02965 [Rhizobiales bacterium NRL2]|nr:MAG: hypothetical protein TEF_02965 [Rhizobiales bacterium NRL2]
MSEHGSQLRIGPTGQIVGFNQPALLDIARARGFDAAVLAELLPAAELGMLETLRSQRPD